MPPISRPAISSHSLGRAWVHDLPSKLAHASAAGFAGIELFHEDLVYHARDLAQRASLAAVTDDDKLAACHSIRALTARLGLEIVCLQPFRNFEGLRDPTTRAARIAAIHVWIRIAHILGTDLIAVASSLLSAAETTGEPDRLAADLAAIADIGAVAEPPVRFTYEALCFGTHVTSLHQEIDIVRRANRPNLGLCLDTFNIAGWSYADPAVAGGVRPDGLERLRAQLTELVSTVRPADVFYIQVVDAERLAQPLVRGHPLYHDDQPARMSWSRGCRLFYGETNRHAYLPIRDIMTAVTDGLGWRGWVSMELFNLSLEDPDETVPKEHAARGMKSWDRLVADLPQLKDPKLRDVDGVTDRSAAKHIAQDHMINPVQIMASCRL